jgi:hypothetical protein
MAKSWSLFHLLALTLFIVGGLWWWNYWTAPETQLRRDTARGKKVLEQFEKAIDPEKLRSWALPYLQDKGTKNNATIVPPKEISHLIGHYPIDIMENSNTGMRFVYLWIRMGGFGPFEAIMVGNTNSTAAPSPPPCILMKWRDGIYYALGYP